MSINLGKDVVTTFNNENYNYDSVVFQDGKPLLDGELNLSQQTVQDLITRMGSSVVGSGWVSYRKPHAEPGIPESFYTQELESAIPEIAMVNGWPIHVTNTNTTKKNNNLVDLSEFPLVSGSRVDGVFLEVWRGLVDDQMSGITTPSDYTNLGVLRSVCVITEDIVWAIGDNGILLKTDNGGTTWKAQVSPTSVSLYDVKFVNSSVGYLAGARGSLYKTGNGGASWSKMDIPAVDDLYTIAVPSADLVVVAGANGTILYAVDSESFTLVTNAKQATEDIFSLFFYSDKVGWACGKNGQFLKTTTGGVTWEVITISVADSGNTLLEKKVTTNLRSVKFANLSDGWIVGENGLILRTTDGGKRWSDTSVTVIKDDGPYTSISQDLLALDCIDVNPLRIDISILRTDVVTSVSYELTATSLTLSYTYPAEEGGSSGITTLTLSAFKDSTAIVNAINTLLIKGVQAFKAIKTWEDDASYTKERSGIINGRGILSVSFSMSARLWAAGRGGIVLRSVNGGATWERVENTSASFDLYAIAFKGDNLGWTVGDQGEINKYTFANSKSSWEGQDSDLTKHVQRKVYYKGNFCSPASLNLVNDSVHPLIKVETTARTQVQYRIRVVEGVDINNFKDAGLGSAYVYSRGPNTSVIAAGSYSYENMGFENGDFGLWRARCRNTVDGYSYAIPMFLVSKRNRQAYDKSLNINGTSVDSLSAIRPDGFTYLDVTSEDIVDIRRKVGNFDIQSVLDSSLDMLLAGNLATSMVVSPKNGGQIGSNLLCVEEVTAEEDAGQIGSIYSGNYNSEAEIEDITPVLVEGPGAEGGYPTVYTFSKLVGKLYMPLGSYFSAVYKSTAKETSSLEGATIPGYFKDLGTDQVIFVFAESGVTTIGVKYQFNLKCVNYSRSALAYSPERPLQVKAFSSAVQNNENFQGVQKDTLASRIRTFETGVEGYLDYAELSPSGFGSLPYSASMVRLHVFQHILETVEVVQVAKNIEGYFAFSVKEIRNIKDGGNYRIAKIESDKESDVLEITLASSFPVPANSVIEIVLEVISPDSMVVADSALGKTSEDFGESIDATRNSLVAIFDKTVKGVSSLFRGSLIEVSPTTMGQYSLPSNVQGVSTLKTLSSDVSVLAWQFNEDGSWTTKLGTLSGNKGSYTVSVLDSAETLYFPALCKVNDLGGGVQVSYTRRAPQTLQPLPSTMEVQVLGTAKEILVLSQGCGGGYRSQH